MTRSLDRYDTPIWRLEVEYERYVRANMKRSQYLIATDVLFDFISRYPKKTMPADFLACHVEDWGRERSSHYSAHNVRRHISYIHGFFKWIQDTKGVDVPNPAVVIRVNQKPGGHKKAVKDEPAHIGGGPVVGS